MRNSFTRLRAATTNLEGRALSAKSDYLTGTSVASAVAMVIMAKEGTLGARAAEFNYVEFAPVKRGMAWLDRNFDLVHQPIFSHGAKSSRDSDAGFAAWLFAVQRLGMLLNVEELGGQRWYANGVRHLKSIQYADGSFEEQGPSAVNGPVRTTSSVLLFLLRSTAPITNSDDDE